MEFLSLLKQRYSAPKTVEVFDLPENIHPVCFLVLGYPSEKSAQNTQRAGRRPLEETVVEL